LIGDTQRHEPAHASPGPALTDAQFHFFGRLAYEHAGIVIADFKRSMVLRRVQKRLKALDLRSVEDYRRLLNSRDGHAEIEPLVNALTTNKTSFFREAHHFDHLRDVALPDIIRRKRAEHTTRIRLWSAGCSTGEEAWSIAMTVDGTLSAVDATARVRTGHDRTSPGSAAHAWDVKILATDIDSDVLATAVTARYEPSEMAPLSSDLKHRYLEPSVGPRNGHHDIVPDLKRLVTFKQLNLHDEWPFQGPFDIIFCRNVVIYFDRAAQRQLFDRFATVLGIGGLLYCGHSESLLSLSSRFRPVSRSVYERIA
jgi:chemotaxis protein methyltransferase CheR